jgi:hypothetical protein
MQAHKIAREDEEYKKECERNARAHRIAWEVEEYRKNGEGRHMRVYRITDNEKKRAFVCVLIPVRFRLPSE